MPLYSCKWWAFWVLDCVVCFIDATVQLQIVGIWIPRLHNMFSRCHCTAVNSRPFGFLDSVVTHSRMRRYLDVYIYMYTYIYTYMYMYVRMFLICTLHDAVTFPREGEHRYQQFHDRVFGIWLQMSAWLWFCLCRAMPSCNNNAF